MRKICVGEPSVDVWAEFSKGRYAKQALEGHGYELGDVESFAAASLGISRASTPESTISSTLGLSILFEPTQEQVTSGGNQTQNGG